MEEIVNRVAKSPLISIDLEDYLSKEDIVLFDIEAGLHGGIILKEKEFRAFLKETDWNFYKDKNVGIICSADAIIPTWAFMLVVTYLKPLVNTVIYGNQHAVEQAMVDQAVSKLITSQNFENAKVVIKGCGGINNKEYAYTKMTDALVTYVSSIMYGEPCSTVPVYKKRKA